MSKRNDMSEERFELTENHIKLLNKANIIWNDAENGAPAIDSKRPYGSSSMLLDASKILRRKNIPVEKGIKGFDRQEFIDSKIIDIHYETRTALEIILSTRSFETGIYEKTSPREDWKKVK